MQNLRRNSREDIQADALPLTVFLCLEEDPPARPTLQGRWQLSNVLAADAANRPFIPNDIVCHFA